jgi:hypothetical protein
MKEAEVTLVPNHFVIFLELHFESNQSDLNPKNAFLIHYDHSRRGMPHLSTRETMIWEKETP